LPTGKAPGLDTGKHLERVRGICTGLAGVEEKPSHGAPTFFANKRVFTMFADNHHYDGHIAVWVPAPQGAQAAMIEEAPERYFRPPYVGGAGWVGIELPKIGDAELAAHIHQAWRMVTQKTPSQKKPPQKKLPRVKPR
jgi:hypothetical protein